MFRVPGVGEAVATRGGTASAVVNVRVSGLERVVEWVSGGGVGDGEGILGSRIERGGRGEDARPSVE